MININLLEKNNFFIFSNYNLNKYVQLHLVVGWISTLKEHAYVVLKRNYILF